MNKAAVILLLLVIEKSLAVPTRIGVDSETIDDIEDEAKILLQNGGPATNEIINAVVEEDLANLEGIKNGWFQLLP